MATDAGHRTPQPSGPLSGRRGGFRRGVGRALAAVNRHLLPTPPGRWLRRRLHASLELTTTDVPVSKPGLDGLRLLFLSDLHAGLFMSAGDLCEIAKLGMAQGPDLVCLGGDLTNTRWEEVRLLDQALEILRAPLGTFAVPGNHEYYRREGLAPWTAHLEERGVEVLVNRGRRLDTGSGEVWVAGVDDLTESEPDLDSALDGRREGEPTLLLSHHPDVFVEARELAVDLQLSGHTHGGQILLLGRAALRHSRHGFLSGLYRGGENHLYVSRGAGVTALPLRIGAAPEVSVLDLRGG